MNARENVAHKGRGFTLVELLVLVAIIAILAGLLLPALSGASDKAKRASCVGNLRQVNLAIHLYADDFADSFPVLPSPNPYPNGVGAYYKQLVKTYLALTGPASPDEKVFICPSDRLMHTQIRHAFESYTFNGYEVEPGDLPRITGQSLSGIKNPTRAVLAGEASAFFGGSWHPWKKETYADAKAALSFVDAHVDFTRIFWDGLPDSQPRNYEPPARYVYRWDGE